MTVDLAGGEDGTVHNGAAFVQGRIGNGVSFDGVDDFVSTETLGVRTDTSFTVAAWVMLEEDGGTLVAVSAAGEKTSKFRLGHVYDDRSRSGAWFFAMPESDTPEATVTEDAKSVMEARPGLWTHLVGVYDAEASRVWLYHNGLRVDDGTVQNTWNATGGLRIGSGAPQDSRSGKWPGLVDDVRLYNRSLTSDEISALYSSYPD